MLASETLAGIVRTLSPPPELFVNIMFDGASVEDGASAPPRTALPLKTARPLRTTHLLERSLTMLDFEE